MVNQGQRVGERNIPQLRPFGNSPAWQQFVRGGDQVFIQRQGVQKRRVMDNRDEPLRLPFTQAATLLEREIAKAKTGAAADQAQISQFVRLPYRDLSRMTTAGA